MKMIKFMAFLMFGGLVFASCSEDEKEDEKTVTVTFEGSYYDALIDTVQYGGPLIYSDYKYEWTDEATSLSGEVVKADWSQWGMGFGWDHGFAISNYVNPEATSYMEQLAVAEAKGNFAVAYENNSNLKFADGKDHEIVSIDIAPVAYAYNNMKKACGEGYEFDVIMTFTKADSTQTKMVIALAKDTDVKKGFDTYPVNQKAVSISFSFDGTDKGNYGLNTPKYVAIDNIVIKK